MQISPRHMPEVNRLVEPTSTGDCACDLRASEQISVIPRRAVSRAPSSIMLQNQPARAVNTHMACANRSRTSWTDTLLTPRVADSYPTQACGVHLQRREIENSWSPNDSRLRVPARYSPRALIRTASTSAAVRSAVEFRALRRCGPPPANCTRSSTNNRVPLITNFPGMTVGIHHESFQPSRALRRDFPRRDALYFGHGPEFPGGLPVNSRARLPVHDEEVGHHTLSGLAMDRLFRVVSPDTIWPRV